MPGCFWSNERPLRQILRSSCLKWANIDPLIPQNFLLYNHHGLTGSDPWQIMRWMSHKLLPGLYCSPACHHLFWSAAKHYRNSSSRPVGMGVAVEDGTLCPQTNQSLSKHTKVLLLLQLETWLDGEEGMLLERSQLHFFSFRKFSWASFQP